MILFQNSIIRLDYEAATDILAVDYPSAETYTLHIVEHSLRVMVDAIRNYDIKLLLLDASQSTMDLGDEENRRLSMNLAADLAKTRLQKLARIQPIMMLNEARAQENIRRIEQAGLLPYQLRTFSSREIALEWLIIN